MYGTNKKMGSILPGRLHKLNNTLNNIQEYTKQYISILYKYTLYEYIVYVNVIMYSAAVLQIMKIFLIFYFSSRVVSIFTPPQPPIHSHLSPLNLPPLALSMCPLYMFLDGPSLIFPNYPSPPPLWLLSVYSLFECLWLYFAWLFVLLIRFHLQVRSYGICLSPPGLFHLA